MAIPVADDARLLDGRYDLLDRLGSGGMGTVYRAHDQRLDREVAIKVLHEGADGDDVRRARLQSEARFAGALQHPGIVQVFDYGEEEQPDGRVRPYVVMQHVSGRPLSAALAEQGPMAPATVVHLLEGVASALQAAHAAGIVHRDLKPSNILVSDAGDPVLVDFGIARSDGAEPLTQTGEIIGTADYLSPEQVRGSRATAASDVYALGVVAYQCLTSTSPFHRETHVATALAHLNDRPTPLPAAVPARLRTLVQDMLVGDPDVRPGAGEVARRAIEAEQAPTVVLPPAPPPAAPRQPPAAVAAASGLAQRWMRAPRRPRTTAVALAAGVVLVGIALVTAFTGRDPGASPAAADRAIPPVRGDSVAEARKELRTAGFQVVVHRVDDARAAGRVLRQDPAPGPVSGTDGTTVTLDVASGWVALDGAGLTGQPYAAAAALVHRLGLVPARQDVPSDQAAPGTVLGSSADGRVRVGSRVVLMVAAAEPPSATARSATHGGDHGGGPASSEERGKEHGKGHDNGHGPGKKH